MTRWMIVTLLLVGSVGCGDPATESGDSCGSTGWSPSSKFKGLQLLVSQTCKTPPAGFDAVYGTLTGALAAADDGSAIFVEAGTYEVTQAVSKPIAIMGRGAGKTLITPALVVDTTGEVLLADLGVTDATGVAISVAKANATLERVTVKNVTAGPSGAGHGIQLLDGAVGSLKDVEVDTAAGTGVLLKEAAAVVDGIHIKGAAGGGIAVVDGIHLPTDTGNDDVSIVLGASVIEKSGAFGFGAFGSSARLQGTSVQDISAPVAGDGGDGIVVVAAAAGDFTVSMDAASHVQGTERAGVLVAGGTGDAAVVDGIHLVADIAGTVEGSQLSGAWAQGAGATLALADGATFVSNKFFGATATAGASLTAKAARITDTVGAPWAPPSGGLPETIGDGLSITGGASLTATGTELIDNARAGIIGDSPSTTAFSLSGVKVQGGEYGVVVQSVQAGSSWAVPQAGVDVDVSGTAKDAVGQDLGLLVRESLCDTGACLPSVP